MASRYGLGSEETEPLPILDVDKSAGASATFSLRDGIIKVLLT